MAVNKETNTNATTRRWFFGANVTILVIVAAFLLVAVNLIANQRNARWDLAGGFAAHRVSDRTKLTLKETPEELRITTVYTSDLPESDREKYLPKLRDYLRELQQIDSGIEVTHISAGDEQAELIERVHSTFRGPAGEYDETIQMARAAWDQVEAKLAPQRAQIEKLMQSDSWIGQFSTLANIAAVIRKDLESLSETRDEVQRLIGGSEGIPRYKEANDKIKAANDELKQHIEESQDWMQQVNDLVEALGDPDSQFAQETKETALLLVAEAKRLRQIAGDPGDKELPEDLPEVLRGFAGEAQKFSNLLNEEFSRVNKFTENHPVLATHPLWQVQEQIFMMELPAILRQMGESLTGNRQQLRQILSMDDLPKDQLQNVVRQLRQVAEQYHERIQLYQNKVNALLQAVRRTDGGTRQFLSDVAGGEVFGDVLEQLNQVSQKIEELPELELDEIANRLEQENIVVIETPDNVKVVTFDEVWPSADPMAGQMPMGQDDAEQRRVFDGDAAISETLLSLAAEKPIATVVLTTYETSPPPQMRQFQRPNTGPIPLAALTELTERLESANFAVKQWNLGAEGPEAQRPDPAEGTEPIYVLLPPAKRPPMNPFMQQQQPQKQFGEPELQKIKEAVAESGRAMFLALAEPRSPMPFVPPPSYAYDEWLREDWGVDVMIDYWVLRGVPDTRSPNRFGVNPLQLSYMPLNNFTEHLIGEPLRARRVLMSQVCPVVPVDSPPDDVDIDKVLVVPAEARDMWGEDDVMRIVRALSEGRDESTFEIGEGAKMPPFSVMLAARKLNGDSEEAAAEATDTQPAEAGDSAKSKIVVIGSGATLRDDYLQRRVARLEGKRARLVTDPPPTENADLAINALYWLADRPDMIASGPAPVPRIGLVEAKTKRNLWLLTFGWATAFLIVGGIVMMGRRK